MITELPDSLFPAQGLLMMELFILIIAFSTVGFEEIERALKPRYSKETERQKEVFAFAFLENAGIKFTRSLPLPRAPEPEAPRLLPSGLRPAPCAAHPRPLSRSTRARVFHVTEESARLTVLTSQHVDLSTPSPLAHSPPLVCPLGLPASLLK